MSKVKAIKTPKTSTPKSVTTTSIPCPKCDGNGAQWVGPIYVPATSSKIPDRSALAKLGYYKVSTKEYLKYACPNCGYVRTENCKDSPFNLGGETHGKA